MEVLHRLRRVGVLRHVLDAYEEMDIRPIVAPEIEFYLVDRNEDPDYPLRTPIGPHGAAGYFTPEFERRWG